MQRQSWEPRADENPDLGPLPWDRLYPKTFLFNFQNLLNAPGRNSTFLCFEVEKWERGACVDQKTGVFRNQLYCGEPCHAELCFLDWFRDTLLSPAGAPSPHVSYQVTWYMSWSPCSECAKQVAGFLREQVRVHLCVSAARLYLYTKRDEKGLRHLVSAGVQVAMMTPEDFEYCWNNFVYNGGRNFRYWKNVRRYYYIMKEQLDEILWGNFRDLRSIQEFFFGKK